MANEIFGTALMVYIQLTSDPEQTLQTQDLATKLREMKDNTYKLGIHCFYRNCVHTEAKAFIYSHKEAKSSDIGGKLPTCPY